MTRNFGRCCNPLNDETSHSKSLRAVPQKVRDRFPHLNETAKICDKCRKKIESQTTLGNDEYAIIVQKMIDKFDDENTSLKEKELIMSFLPDSWSVRRKADFFCTSRRFAQNVVNLSKKPTSSSGVTVKHNQLPDETIKLVENFYSDDENSRIMPGMKDTKCVKISSNQKIFVQKRLVLYNLRELYIKFKDMHPTVRIGFSKFAQFRPPQCVLAGSSGTHSVCVCIHHQNVKLMLDGLGISKFTSGKLNDYKDCLSIIVCQNPTDDCFLNKCKKCPSIESFKKLLFQYFDEKSIDQVQYQCWHSTDRCSLQTRITSKEDYVNELSRLLFKLKTHSFTAKKQSAFLDWLKQNLKEGEFLVLLDFAENYAFLIQDAVQAFHYNNDQCTIVTVVLYYIKDSKLHHTSMAVLSDSLIHDSAFVHCVQKIVTTHIKENFPAAKKVIYFSDGAAQHFKNKYNFVNLINHKNDFSLEAEWHFNATAHGKNACDGVGACLKSNARRASLQKNSTSQITTPRELFVWAREKMENMRIFFVSKEEYLQVKSDLTERSDGAKTVPGTLSYHSFQVLETTKQLLLRPFSTYPDGDVFPKLRQGEKRKLETPPKREFLNPSKRHRPS
ncbi:hypothetical protein QAD02_014517 [Eretmocerus hayati]|uniref:Uncharacterized protein n=2 Tax=Eretmocerus hayati TaxID=131215 RepID=A0ACC2P595_9HYME|nr:hypothetical protein QAD02_001061 [Eretmocerus hayati]KAJ8678730.1 hypothetical protein QAD02_014517 [Eretmocerus hayati]